MKATAIAIAAAVSAWAAVPFQPTASHVPVRWTVETSRVQPAAFEAYQGETLDLEATMQSYGNPFAIAGDDVRIYWQTNGMGAAWWSAPASVKVGKSGERDTYAASWTPDMDAGAGVYNCFIGQPAGNYRAEFRLRLRPSPGATPNTLRLPDVTYDARLNGTPTVNGTNLTDLVKLEMDSAMPQGVITTNEVGVLGGPIGGIYMSMYPDSSPMNIEISPFDLDSLLIRAESEAFIFNGLTNVTGENDVMRRKDVPSRPGDIGAASEEWVLSLQTTYTNFSASAMVAINQSVQKIDVSSSARLSVRLPELNAGQTGDFVVYAVNTTSEDIPLSLPAGTWYMQDEANTNAIGSGVTAFYFTELAHGVWCLGRQELKPVEVK